MSATEHVRVGGILVMGLGAGLVFAPAAVDGVFSKAVGALGATWQNLGGEPQNQVWGCVLTALGLIYYHAGASRNEAFVKTFVVAKASVVALLAAQYLRGKVPLGSLLGVGGFDGVSGLLAARAAGMI
ncbi:hypothetical protein DFJ74DRAFT_695103 [Hyaloraphidium curvatum]|nr:hypothetical protein DFJ74DRAFT_695103 [Hyaloraphidium curvatum]